MPTKTTTKRTPLAASRGQVKAKSIKVRVKKIPKSRPKLKPKAKPKANPMKSEQMPTLNNTPTTQLIPKIYKRIIITSILFLVVLTMLVIHYSFAKALITITPKYSEHDISFSAQIVDPTQSNLNIDEKDYLIGRKLETVLSETGNFTPTPSKSLGDKASGNITIVNNYSKEQTLVETTRLLTSDGILFHLAKTVTVPAGSKISAIAIADESGDKYLVGPGKLTIPGLWEGLQDKIFAENSQSMAFNEIIYHEVTAETINTAISSLREQITAKAIEEFQPQLSANEFINKDALIIQEIRRSTSAVIGEDADNFDVELELSIKTLTYDEQKLLAKIENDINILAEQNQGLINFSNNDVSVSISENEEVVNGVIGLIQGKYKIQLANPNIDLEQIKDKTPTEAIEYLTNLSSISSANVTLAPFWLKTIPKLDNHIEIILNK
jgi:hypothetical protein